MAESVAAGKRIWMTEWFANRFGSPNAILAPLGVAKAIHYLFTSANVSAFVYWWPRLLVTDDKPNKVLWAIAHYSRFARPGWHLLEADSEPIKDVFLAAFSDPEGKALAIVVVNQGQEAQTLSLIPSPRKFGSLAVYRTSATENMQALKAIEATAGDVQATVPPQSITTFYGQTRE